jgi:hypothetical protein
MLLRFSWELPHAAARAVPVTLTAAERRTLKKRNWSGLLGSRFRPCERYLRAIVMISRLVAVMGPRCQSPYWALIWKPTPGVHEHRRVRDPLIRDRVQEQLVRVCEQRQPQNASRAGGHQHDKHDQRLDPAADQAARGSPQGPVQDVADRNAHVHVGQGLMDLG